MYFGTIMKSFIILVLTASLVFCVDRRIEKRGDDSIAPVSSEDQAMNKIMVEARRTWVHFSKQMKSPRKNQRDFMVKYPFDADPGTELAVEHIWLSNLTVKDGKYFGTLANDPFYIKSLKMGQEVQFLPEKISDWKYIEDNYLVGGKSIIYLMKDLSPEDRKAILRQIDFKIRDLE